MKYRLSYAALRKSVSSAITYNLYQSARISRTAVFDGIPIITGSSLGRLEIGERAILVSHPRGTLLGVRGPVILRLLAPNAELVVGDEAGLSGTVICAAHRVIVGKRCLIGSDVMIMDTDFHDLNAEHRKSEFDWRKHSSPVEIKDDVFIGTRTLILKGVTIGRGAVIGAGSVVTRNVEPYTVVAGAPARYLSDVKSARS